MNVNWDDYSQLNGKIKLMFQTTNQISYNSKVTGVFWRLEVAMTREDPHPPPPKPGGEDPLEDDGQQGHWHCKCKAQPMAMACHGHQGRAPTHGAFLSQMYIKHLKTC